jgi:hypothetical protein
MVPVTPLEIWLHAEDLACTKASALSAADVCSHACRP